MPTSRRRRTLLWGIFALYACFLLFLLFFSRKPHTERTLLQHLQRTSNLVPFHTILRHGKGLWKGIRNLLGEGHTVTWHLSYYGQNLLGNLVMFFPFGLLAPTLFPRCNRLLKLALLTAGIVAVAELSQGLLRVGSPDVDDVILNTVGAVAGYLTRRSPAIRPYLQCSPA